MNHKFKVGDILTYKTASLRLKILIIEQYDPDYIFLPVHPLYRVEMLHTGSIIILSESEFEPIDPGEWPEVLSMLNERCVCGEKFVPDSYNHSNWCPVHILTKDRLKEPKL